jgi:hypothetical protein
MDRTEPPYDRLEPPEVPGRPAAASGASAEAEPSPEPPVAERPAAGLRRVRVSRPPRAWKAAGNSRNLVGVFPDRYPVTDSRPAANSNTDPDPVSIELLALPLFDSGMPKSHPQTSAPPTAWKSVGTVELLKSIIPPMGSLDESGPSEARVATTAETLRAVLVQPNRDALKAAATRTATPVADIRARYPESRPMRQPTLQPAVAPAGAPVAPPGSALSPSSGKPTLGQRIVWTFLRLTISRNGVDGSREHAPDHDPSSSGSPRH